MLRRLASPFCQRALTVACLGRADIITTAHRWSSASTPSTSSNVSSDRGFRRRSNQLPPLPPAFDIVHWNDADIAKGHLLRVLHHDSYIVLDYYRQARKIMDDEGRRATVGGQSNAERLVTVTLPPAYIARFLGVLEGRMNSVEVQSRFTNATFMPDPSKTGKHYYTLRCVSRQPTTGQRQMVNGADVTEETVEWQVDLDPAESLMLHRFLLQALKYNTGFGR